MCLKKALKYQYYKIYNVIRVYEIKLNQIIFIGGQETTALVNSSTIYMLSHHQDIQKRVNIVFN